MEEVTRMAPWAQRALSRLSGSAARDNVQRSVQLWTCHQPPSPRREALGRQIPGQLMQQSHH